MTLNPNLIKIFLSSLILILCFLPACKNDDSDQEVQTKAPVAATEKYEANWESLQKYETPEWFKDAKFGIFIHWGPYSVPAFGSEWYPRLMYMDEALWDASFEVSRKGPTDAYKHHVKTYGHPGKFGYKDFIPMFKGEHFNAKEWISLFNEAGAKYVVPVAEHHDAFAMYNSKHTRWNAVNMGPKKDILGELFEEARKTGLKTGASSHLAFNWAYFNRKPEFDNWDSKNDDLYGINRKKTDKMTDEWRTIWWNRTKDIIDNYQPDLMWFDFYLDKEAFRPNHPEMAAYYYNKGIDWGKEVVMQNKNLHGFESFPPGINVLDIERSKMSDIRKNIWQTDTSIGVNSWGYVHKWISKSPNTLIDDLVDIVSKNGCLLLNVGPKADGTIPNDQQEVLREIGQWLKINGVAVYGSRPWKVFGEGPTKIVEGHISEKKNKDLTFDDVRFTTNNNKLYTTIMDWPSSNQCTIKELAKGSKNCQWDIKNIKLLGNPEKIEWEHTNTGLTIKFPKQKTGNHAFVFEVDFGENSKEAIKNNL